MESSATLSLKLSSPSSSLFSPSQNPSPKLNPFPCKTIKYPSFSFKSIKCSSLGSSNSKNNDSKPNFALSAVTSSSSSTTEHVAVKLQNLISEFQSFSEPADRLKRVLDYASTIPAFPDSSRVDSNRVMGCTSRVWLDAQLDNNGKMRFLADSDSDVTRGFCACLISLLNGAAPEEVLSVSTEDLSALNVGLPGGERSRVNTWHNVLVSMQKRTKKLVAQREGRKDFDDSFPSLIINSEGIQAKGTYAEAQAKFLMPDESRIQELVNALKEKNIGVVAHFYMDPEVQGVLTAAQKQWPHIQISDSLVMADKAVKMAQSGCKYIAVLGVDFMSENVRAILDQAGYEEVTVYRMSDERIGCSLADAASSTDYMNYLEAASETPNSLHVVYINTSLETKAFAHEIVPTVTCTSSNVVQTILQGFSQVPDLNVWYGPDSYMGANIAKLFQQMTLMTDDEIAEVHPDHNRESIKSLLPRLHYYQDGMCTVHHLFGHEVVEKINEMHCDAFLTAHLEVPGEMFSLAMDAKKRGMGVVGSTSNILDFIKERVQEALDRNVDDHLQFVLGTESGMITAIVAAVRDLFSSAKASGGPKVNVEIVFPVSSEAMTSNPSPTKAGEFVLPVVPGVASGEGCSIHGGCASCPYMKMNSLQALLKVCHNLPDEKNTLAAYKADRYKQPTRSGKSIAEVGCEPILHMRHFQTTKELPEKLVNQVQTGSLHGKA
ncbi:quinolinate synthase, chloroplastic-like [Mercurialis annua]|uniref:quinolinate synthase, chloroplastic-like n=1 Tax=Mercurialis annua TaxID=3986 RepID=UPI00215F0A26|nr:quinolinate synthase, chloroplastic-like [Mercurialis annua]